MTVTIEVNKIRRTRLFQILFLSFAAQLIFFLSYIFLLLFFPPLLIKLDRPALFLTPLISFFFFCLSFVYFAYKAPFWGRKFFEQIAASQSLPEALSLEQDKPVTVLDPTISQFFKDKFLKNIRTQLKDDWLIENKIKFNKKIYVIISILLLLMTMISIYRFSFIKDLHQAIRSGMPFFFLSYSTPIPINPLHARIQPPAYIDLTKETIIDLNAQSHITVLRGSRIIIEGNLKKNFLTLEKGHLILASQGEIEYHRLEFDENQLNNFQTSFIAQNGGSFIFHFIDKTQNISKSRVYEIKIIKDQPPAITILSPPREHKLFYGQSLKIIYHANDDNGLNRIYLFHREANSEQSFRKVLVNNFNRSRVHSYHGDFIWNPVIEHERNLTALIYPPNVSKIEYYLQVQDSNNFSEDGHSRTPLYWLKIENKMVKMSTAIKELEIIKNNLKDNIDRNPSVETDKSIKKLENSIANFTKNWDNKWKDILPRDNLPDHLKNLLSKLKQKQATNQDIKQMHNYLSFYIKALQIYAQAERIKEYEQYKESATQSNNAMVSHSKKEAHKTATNSMRELLKKKYPKEWNEMQRKIKQGDIAAATELLKKMLNNAIQEMKKDRESMRQSLMKLSEKVRKILEQLTNNAKDVLNKQEKNLKLTKNNKFALAHKNQNDLTSQIQTIYHQIKKLEKEVPFLSPSLAANANMAQVLSRAAQNELNRKDKINKSNIIQAQQETANYLKNLIKTLENQKKNMERMSQGDLSQMMPDPMRQEYIIIPKEAYYTVPFDFKKKIIENSRDRSRLSPDLEKFWQKLLE